MKAAAGVVAGLVLGLVIAACTRPMGVPLKAEKKNELTALWTQIRDWRVEAHMGVEPPGSLFQTVEDKTVSQAANVCPDSYVPPKACTDVCDLADAICDNAERICGLAGELAPDAWAEEKCTSAKASCKEAKQLCCGCDDQVDAAPATGSTP